MKDYHSNLQFILHSIKPFRWMIGGMAFIGLVWAAENSLTPYILKIIVDRIQNNAPYTDLIWPAAASIIISIIVIAMYRYWDYLWLSVNPPLKRYISELLMERMMCHSHQLYQDNFAGSLGNKIKEIMSGIPDLVERVVNKFLPYTLIVIIAVGTVWTVNIKFALLLSGWVVLFVAVALFFARIGSGLSEQASERRSGAMGTIVDILGNMANVRLFAGRPVERKILKKDLNAYVAADQKRDWHFLRMFAALGGLWVLYEGASLWLLIDGFKKGQVTAGDFVLVLNIGMAIVHSLWDLSRVISEFSELYGQVKQGLKIILQPIAIQDQTHATELHATKGEIVFEKVNFFYKNASPLFQDKSVIIRPGEKVGLVGYSGSGKSTFVNLALRIFEIKAGRILIDGQDIRQVTQDSLHMAIGMIPQDPVLFHRSLKENIRYGKADASDTEVIEAARRAYADDFIRQLPEQYEALVGERGIKLSGGQRQRIAIARAFLKNAPILILDEATSQLDSVTENKIQDSLWELMQGKTTIVVAHRLSTLLRMDRILVFNKGRIVEDGSHAALLAKEGLYKAMWEAQVGGFLPE